ncbi:MAG: FHA domain-containing protein [Anaerolineae bacterium]|nr:FHA domain-containing protein [Anaerolineae bacterium]
MPPSADDHPCRFRFADEEVTYERFKELVSHPLTLSAIEQMTLAAQSRFEKLYCPTHGRATEIIVHMTGTGELVIKVDFCCADALAASTAPLEAAVEQPPSTDRIEGARLTLRIDGTAAVWQFAAEDVDVITIGRELAEEPAALDLEPFGGDELGVSRRHATIERRSGAFFLTDTGSTNGTWLNRMRLMPHQPYLLEEANTVQFGHMTVTVELVSRAGERRRSADGLYASQTLQAL